MKTPTEEDKALLREAKAFYGRSWRSAIQQAWLTGNYKGINDNTASALQRLRNNPDRTWNPKNVRV